MLILCYNFIGFVNIELQPQVTTTGGLLILCYTTLLCLLALRFNHRLVVTILRLLVLLKSHVWFVSLKLQREDYLILGCCNHCTALKVKSSTARPVFFVMFIVVKVGLNFARSGSEISLLCVIYRKCIRSLAIAAKKFPTLFRLTSQSLTDLTLCHQAPILSK